jgi:hypothetical protein
VSLPKLPPIQIDNFAAPLLLIDDFYLAKLPTHSLDLI